MFGRFDDEYLEMIDMYLSDAPEGEYDEDRIGENPLGFIRERSQEWDWKREGIC